MQKNKTLLKETNQMSGIKKSYRANDSSIVISSILLDEIVPVQNSKYGDILTQYSRKDIEEIGLFVIKFKAKSF